MNLLENLKDRVKSIPEFSDRNYAIAGYIIAALVTIAGGFFIYLNSAAL